MASAMEFLDEQEKDEERIYLMEELVKEESINEIEEVGKVGKREKPIIPFPCLISDPCRQVGVLHRCGDEVHTMTDLYNSQTLTDLTEAADFEHLLPLGSRKRQKTRQQMDNEQNTDKEDHGVVLATEQRPAWFNA
ncbi:hypothetical protein LWI28_021281 [Acer negundo]|uniref:Uncharacterized protein n=1 Tax=Acer negundo TaxID=4023 RepID=A0AAD5P640_ACENE|nr:hypothetical protein LWI28_021281 [Acer negundo]